MVGVGSPTELFGYGTALPGRCRVAKGRGERSARAGEVEKSGPGRLWAEGRKPARKADMDGLPLVNEATLSRSTESCKEKCCLICTLREGTVTFYLVSQAAVRVGILHVKLHNYSVHPLDRLRQDIEGMPALQDCWTQRTGEEGRPSLLCLIQGEASFAQSKSARLD